MTGKRESLLPIASDLPEDLFLLQPALSAIYDELEQDSRNPFEGDLAKTILDRIWQHESGPSGSSSSSSNGVSGGNGGTGGKRDREESVRALIEGRRSVSPDHPIAYLPSLLAILGPQIIPIYKAALTGKRVLLYSQPPLLPVGAFAWCIAAMALAPPSVGGVGVWLGNVGLMDLGELKMRKGGWIATTSDAIYRSHSVYDLYIDLSTTPPTLSTPPPPHTTSSSSRTPPPPLPTTYHLSDLPLYRSLLLLDSSPPSISLTHGPSLQPASIGSGSAPPSIYSGQGGWWLLAFDVFSSVYALCVGVCEYAVGRGRPAGGAIQLSMDEEEREGEEDARLLPRDLEDIESEDGLLGSTSKTRNRRERKSTGAELGNDIGAEEEEEEEDEDGAVRRGRLILRQLYHSTYHLHARLDQITRHKDRSGRPGMSIKLDDKQVKELVGTKLYVPADEARFWQDLARCWGMTAGTEREGDEDD